MTRYQTPLRCLTPRASLSSTRLACSIAVFHGSTTDPTSSDLTLLTRDAAACHTAASPVGSYGSSLPICTVPDARWYSAPDPRVYVSPLGRDPPGSMLVTTVPTRSNPARS